MTSAGKVKRDAVVFGLVHLYAWYTYMRANITIHVYYHAHIYIYAFLQNGHYMNKTL